MIAAWNAVRDEQEEGLKLDLAAIVAAILERDTIFNFPLLREEKTVKIAPSSFFP